MSCEFCGQPSTLLCDGKINGVSCDKQMCRSCGKKIADVMVRSRSGCRRDTRDLCPDCQEATRKAEEDINA